MSPTIAVLALQGAFIEHEQRLQSLGCTTIELRQAADLARPFDGLVLPGGESTVQAKLLHDLGMFEPLRQRIAEGLPALGTCAGLILLAAHFRTLPVTVRRNAYGRQLDSFRTEGEVAGIGQVPMTFIRRPRRRAPRHPERRTGSRAPPQPDRRRLPPRTRRRQPPLRSAPRAFEARLLNQPIDGARAARRPQPFHKRLVHQPIERAADRCLRLTQCVHKNPRAHRCGRLFQEVDDVALHRTRRQHMNGMEATCFV